MTVNFNFNFNFPYFACLISSFNHILPTDIELPKEFEFNIEEEDDEDEAIPKDDEWNDLGLDQFLADMAQSVAPPILSSTTDDFPKPN